VLSPAQFFERSLSKEKKKLANICVEIEQKRKRLFEENRKRISLRMELLRMSKLKRN